MLKFILRRLGSSALVLFGASILLYVLTVNSGDPLKDLRESQASNREQLMQARIDYMGLDDPWYERYWNWLTGVVKYLIGAGTLGTDRSGVQVESLLGNAAASTLRLVVLATVLAIVIGVAIGIITAIRQYSGLDYAVTFLIFLFFSLPVFWAAVLLKEYLAIGFNNWIARPTMDWPLVIGLAVVLGLALQAAMGGRLVRRLLTFAATVAVIVLGGYLLFALDMWRNPRMGPLVQLLIGLAVAVGGTALVAGLKNRSVLKAALATVAVGVVAYYATYGVLMQSPSGWLIAGLGVIAVLVGVLAGRLLGGFSKGSAVSVSVVTALVMGLSILAEHMMNYWPQLLKAKPRPIATIGAETPNLTGHFWVLFLDKGTQLLLPTVLLTIISVATYSRYTRSSMLEVSRQDYIRTARAKGLGERQVILKHAFRNSLIPITTIMAFDFAGLIGGAVITESVFGWKGMGELFRTGLDQVDPAPVMAFFLVTGTAAVLMNLVADILYAVLDPRIRV
ncbi:ABC transporter permease [Micrococcus porci]|uniref:ABC transporter permease n=1 Tax=Micrococcus TaxID=1269 RepID=UPI001CCB86FA|nr:ABC transporter permease [Micrococcus porci]MCG7421794.1 ABC transporter permease [Micrococcus sp. ACRRV]UBH25773.1 ABC transporter permease [Micrococcus porci]